MDIKKYKKEQLIRRMALTIFCSNIFSFPWTYKIRNYFYSKLFSFGNNLLIEDNVWVRRTHGVSGTIKSGNKLLLGRNVDIDYTGSIDIGNNVSILEGVKILTHGHDFLGLKNDSELISGTNRVYLTKLFIEDNALIGSRSIIMPEVGLIGKNAIISAGSVVTKRVEANTVVAGNPAKVIFNFPEEMRKDTKNIFIKE